MLSEAENRLELNWKGRAHMRAVIQRVSEASVTVNGEVTGAIGKGLGVLLGVMEGDTEREADFLAKKVCELRIFTDEQDRMNRSVQDVNGGVLVISQFTLAADCSHGRRPFFGASAKPEEAEMLYEYFVARVRAQIAGPVGTGVFGEHMEFRLVNDGPVTIWLDTDEIMKKG